MTRPDFPPHRPPAQRDDVLRRGEETMSTPYVEINTYRKRLKPTNRSCRVCHREQELARYHRTKAVTI